MALWQKENSRSGCKNEQQDDFEVQLENKITFAGVYCIIHNCKKLGSKLQPNVQNARCPALFVGIFLFQGEHIRPTAPLATPLVGGSIVQAQLSKY